MASDKAEFEAWLAKMVSLSNWDKRVPLRELDQAYLEHVARVGVTGHSSLDNDWKVMRERFPAASVTKHEVEKLRSQLAPAKWKVPGTRKGLRG